MLNRTTRKAYVGLSTAAANYSYDGNSLTCNISPPAITSPTNLIGRMSGSCSNLSSSKFSYDPMGRLINDVRNNKGSGSSPTKLQAVYTYWLNGSLNTLKYPSGHTLTYTPNAAGQVIQVTDDASNTFVNTPTGYPTTSMYTPNGALANMVSGTGILTTNTYNSRLQPIRLSAGLNGPSPFFSLCYDFHLRQAINSGPCTFGAYTSGNNGNVIQVFDYSQTDARHQVLFTYDPLNRITQANTATTAANCWGEVYTIDAWGNLYARSRPSGMSTCATEPLGLTASTQNHLSSYSYDIAGNVLTDGTGNAVTYDAENRIATDAGYTYSYDANGVRTEKAAGTTGTMYWPGPDGNLAETDLTGAINEEYVFFNGERIARIDRPSGTVHYYFSDHLQSLDVITDASGTVQERCYYYPYGGQLSCTGSDSNHYKFTGKERDSESGSDYFGARYYTSNLSRFMIPDWAAKPTSVPYASFGNPQSLNLYSYVNNNPATTRDPDGHGCPPDCSTGSDVGDFLSGGMNAFGSDNLLGVGRVNMTTTSGRVGQAFGDFAATVQGAGEALFGGGVEVGGVALDATGVGAVAGVPANIAGAGLILHGGATAETGFSNLFKNASNGPYKRPSNATTPEQRASVQDKPCATCGATGQKNNADHIEPLVVQHYKGGIDKSKMPQSSCSSSSMPELLKSTRRLPQRVLEGIEKAIRILK